MAVEIARAGAAHLTVITRRQSQAARVAVKESLSPVIK
jgi:hypothetical protein